MKTQTTATEKNMEITNMINELFNTKSAKFFSSDSEIQTWSIIIPKEMITVSRLNKLESFGLNYTWKEINDFINSDGVGVRNLLIQNWK